MVEAGNAESRVYSAMEVVVDLELLDIEAFASFSGRYISRLVARLFCSTYENGESWIWLGRSKLNAFTAITGATKRCMRSPRRVFLQHMSLALDVLEKVILLAIGSRNEDHLLCLPRPTHPSILLVKLSPS